MNYCDFEFAYFHYPPAPQTSYKIGGQASIALLPLTVEKAKKAYTWTREPLLPELILSGVFRFTCADDDQQVIYDHYRKQRLQKQ